MSRSSPAIVAATAVFFVGLALVVAGALLLSTSKGVGLGLMGGGFLLSVLSGPVSSWKRKAPPREKRSGEQTNSSSSV